VIHDLLAVHVADLRPGDEIPSATRLGTGGLGLDSLALAEVLVAYEERFGVSATELLEGEPITVGLLIRHAGPA
jgi:acyl carrier protein